MLTIDDPIPEHKAQERGRRQYVDTEWGSLRAGLAGPGQTQSVGHEGYATGGILDEGEESGKAPHYPEHGIQSRARAVHGLHAVTSQGAGEMGDDVRRAGPDQAN